MLSIFAWWMNSFCIAICSGMMQYGSPCMRAPSYCARMRSCSTSERRIASSPMTHTTPSIMFFSCECMFVRLIMQSVQRMRIFFMLLFF